MPVNNPDMGALIKSVSEILETQFLPRLEDKDLIYQARVAINVLELVQRELLLGNQQEQRETESLQALLGQEEGVEVLNALLIARIEAGDFDKNPKDLLVHFRKTVMDKIAIDNPRYKTFQSFKKTGNFDL